MMRMLFLCAVFSDLAGTVFYWLAGSQLVTMFASSPLGLFGLLAFRLWVPIGREVARLKGASPISSRLAIVYLVAGLGGLGVGVALLGSSSIHPIKWLAVLGFLGLFGGYTVLTIFLRRGATLTRDPALARAALIATGAWAVVAGLLAVGTALRAQRPHLLMLPPALAEAGMRAAGPALLPGTACFVAFMVCVVVDLWPFARELEAERRARLEGEL